MNELVSDLGLVLSKRVPAATAPLEAAFARELTLEDVVLEEETELGSITPTLKSLRDSHHTIARLLAMGKRQVEVAAITGYSQSRISILKNDPGFRELLNFYRENTAAEYVDVHKRISALALDATETLHERLIEEPDKVTTGQLLQIAAFGHDRTGFGPTSKTQNENLNMTVTPAELAEMKAAASKESRGNVERIGRAALPAGKEPGVGGADE